MRRKLEQILREHIWEEVNLYVGDTPQFTIIVSARTDL